jgi:Met-zincin
VPASRQRQALKALLTTLSTSTLWPDQRVLQLMSPRPPSYAASDESFSADTGQIFDALRPVEDAASLAMGEILKPTRAVRLAKAKARDPNALGVDEVLSEVVNSTWKSGPEQGSAGSAQRAIALTVLRSLLSCATSKSFTTEVRGACWVALDDIVKWTRAHPAAPDWLDAYAFATHAIRAAERADGALEFPKRRALILDPM